MIPSRDIDDQRILESDWSKSTTDHIQSRVVVFNATILWWLSPYKKLKISIGSVIFIADPSMNQSDWMRDTEDNTQPGATFSWWLTQCKETKIT